MSLSERLSEAGQANGGASRAHDSSLDDLRRRVHEQLIDDLGPILYDKRLSEEDLRQRVTEKLQAAIAAERTPPRHCGEDAAGPGRLR